LCADFLVPRLSIYTTTKATVKAFSKALRAEKLPLDIYCVKPSGVSTAMLGFAKVEGFMISPE
jgi:short-subunit dehydrogenase